jgi:preprotein translocase subunit SecG
MILYGLIIAIHVTASLVLIAVILLQAGRGGGLSETFGGNTTQTILGTKTSVFLKRATAVSAIVYILTCLTLAVLTGHRGRSLVAKGQMAPVAQQGGVPLRGTPFADEPMDY